MAARPNQAHDHGEIIGSGVADSVARDAKDRIEVITGWNSDVDIDLEWQNSYRGQPGAHQPSSGSDAPIGDIAERSGRPVGRTRRSLGGMHPMITAFWNGAFHRTL